jgi:hypothetical protein
MSAQCAASSCAAVCAQAAPEKQSNRYHRKRQHSSGYSHDFPPAGQSDSMPLSAAIIFCLAAMDSDR